MTGDEAAPLAGAKTFLAGERGIIETARALSSLRDVRPELQDSVMVFTGIDRLTRFRSATFASCGSPKRAPALDPEIAAAAGYYRPAAREACGRIVRVLG